LKSVECEAKIISYGIESRDCFVRAKNIRECRWAKHSFDLFVGGKKISRVRLSVSGKHQIYNALAAVCVCVALGICDDATLSGIENFSGIKRRFEDIGTLCGAKVFHDYAHHPTEIQANIKAAKKFTKGKLFVVFQPHTFSRTRDLWDDFLHCFDGADEICIFKIYPAREEPIDGIDEMHLSKEIDSIHHNCFCSNSFDDLFERLKGKLSNGDTLLILGAGDINAFCEYIKEKT